MVILHACVDYFILDSSTNGKDNNFVVSADINEFSSSSSPENDTRDKRCLKDNLTNLSFDSCIEHGIYEWSPTAIPDDLESCRDRMRSNLKFVKDRNPSCKGSTSKYSCTIRISQI